MKGLMLSVWCLAVGFAPSVVLADAENLPRNPFWPQGHEGTRYAISAEPRFKPEPAEAAEIEVDEEPAAQTDAAGQAQQAKSAKPPVQKPKDPLEDPVWNDAVKVLHFGATLGFSHNGNATAAITINDGIYTVGDLVSANFEGHRFTWKIESLSTDGKIKLKRVNYRMIGTNP